MPPMIWPFDQQRVDRLADVVRRRHLAHRDLERQLVDLQIDSGRPVAVDGVRVAAVRVFVPV